MTRRVGLQVLVLGLVVVGCACDLRGAPDLAEEAEAAVRAQSEARNAAARDGDVEAFAALYAEDAVVMAEGIPAARGADAVRKLVAATMRDPAFSLTLEPGVVDAARSGDLAYETGRYARTTTGVGGQPTTDVGSFVAVWRREPGGSWRCVAEMSLSDTPAGEEPPTGD